MLAVRVDHDDMTLGGKLRDAVQEQAFDGCIERAFERAGHALEQAQQFVPGGFENGIRRGGRVGGGGRHGGAPGKAPLRARGGWKS